MRFDGVWRECDDGVVRPVIRGEVRAADGAWAPVPFLLDVGADRTVFSAAVFRMLGAQAQATGADAQTITELVVVPNFMPFVRVSRSFRFAIV
jgi:hypothetical protein